MNLQPYLPNDMMIRPVTQMSNSSCNAQAQNAEVRRFVQNKIYDYLIVTVQQLSSHVPMKRIIDLTRVLDKAMFNASSTLDEYMNMDTFETRLIFYLKQLRNAQRQMNSGLGQQQQEDVQRGALEDQQQENEGHEKEALVENMGGEEIMLLDISSDEEETKPQFDHLSMLMPVSKSPSHIETSGENLEILMAAAVVLKDELVKHLVKTAHKVDTADMVRSANKCFIGLKSLKVDYGAFHGEVRKLIKHFQELKEVNEKNTCPDLDLKVAYEKSMSDVNAAREELANAGSNLIIAQTDYQSKMQRIEKLIAKTHRLIEEAEKERIGIGNLETKRYHCDEVLLLAEKRKAQYENIQRSVNRLKGLV